ncbi:MAG: NUDIX hydrolase [Candidatus Nitrosotenuis sp.]|nr:NUDIX hydrolase [Candidatus Nitrosotenuis sp.]
MVRIAPKKEYDRFRRYFAFPCVDLVIFDGQSVLLTKRTRNPYRGYWHLPGSIIHRGEKITDVVRRSAKEELGLTVRKMQYIGVYESMDKFRHDVAHGFLISVGSGKISLDSQSSEFRFFKRLPSKIIPHHRKVVNDACKLAVCRHKK